MKTDPTIPGDATQTAEQAKCQRQHLRVSDAEGVVSVGVDGEPDAVDAELIDESCAGVGLALDASWSLEPGATVIVDFFGTPVTGVVRHCTPLADDCQQVGVEWTPGSGK